MHNTLDAEFAKEESSQLPLEMKAVPLLDLAAALESLISPIASQKSVAFSCDMSNCRNEDGALFSVAGDFDRLLQILVNLSTNAIKFIDGDGRVSVTARQMGSRVEIAVSDTGSGIAPEHIRAIFDPFVQVGGVVASHGGVGLGLATSRSIARRMGSDIDVSSVLGEGSVFSLLLEVA